MNRDPLWAVQVSQVVAQASTGGTARSRPTWGSFARLALRWCGRLAYLAVLAALSLGIAVPTVWIAATALTVVLVEGSPIKILILSAAVVGLLPLGAVFLWRTWVAELRPTPTRP